MACKCAKPTDEFHGWECSITDGACMFLYPDSKACAEEYGEGPDAEHDEENQYPFGYCWKCKKEFNSELVLEYEITHCPWCGQPIDEENGPTELVYPEGTGE